MNKDTDKIYLSVLRELDEKTDRKHLEQGLVQGQCQQLLLSLLLLYYGGKNPGSGSSSAIKWLSDRR